MATMQGNRARHITNGNVFDDLGFSAKESLALKFRARILSAIIEEVRRKDYRQAQLVDLLDEHQPVISNLLRGKISQMSLEKLLVYAERLGLHFEIRPARSRRRRSAA